MLTQICQYLRNWFDKDQPKIHGVISIENGDIALDSSLVAGNALGVRDGRLYASNGRPVLQDAQFYRIVGSVFNDGVHIYTPSGQNLHDEVFNGSIWAMAIPPEILALADEIETWVTAHSDAINSPFMSESFSGYSYSKGAGYNGGAVSWQSQFASRLSPWRKI